MHQAGEGMKPAGTGAMVRSEGGGVMGIRGYKEREMEGRGVGA